MFFEVIRYAAQECGDDIAKHCQGVELGGGRIYSCLKGSGDQLSDACAAVIGQIACLQIEDFVSDCCPFTMAQWCAEN